MSVSYSTSFETSFIPLQFCWDNKSNFEYEETLELTTSRPNLVKLSLTESIDIPYVACNTPIQHNTSFDAIDLICRPVGINKKENHLKHLKWLVLLGSTLTLFGCKRITLEPFSHKEGQFTVRAPGPMKYSEQTIKILFYKVKIHAFQKHIKNRIFTLSYNDLPLLVTKLSSTSKLLSNSAQGTLKKFKSGKMLSQKPIKQGTIPGLEYRAFGMKDSFELDFYGRVFIRNSRFYHVLAIQKKGTDPQIAYRYIRSFRITGKHLKHTQSKRKIQKKIQLKKKTPNKIPIQKKTTQKNTTKSAPAKKRK